MKIHGRVQFRHKRARGCALKGKLQIRAFARFAQNYAVRVSDFVRKQLAGFTALVLVSPLNAPEDSGRTSCATRTSLSACWRCRRGLGRKAARTFIAAASR